MYTLLVILDATTYCLYKKDAIINNVVLFSIFYFLLYTTIHLYEGIINNIPISNLNYKTIIHGILALGEQQKVCFEPK